ncbi:MAG: hypothetical protein KBS55_01495 [Bacteroidales bacterium]|nr:hypothetical protein [Candidatus Cryptobacteroides aphodequi]
MRHKDNRDSIDFANEPVGKLFRQMLLPTVLGMLSIVMLNFTDGAFIGHGAGRVLGVVMFLCAPLVTAIFLDRSEKAFALVIPAFIFLPKLFGTAGIWLSVPTAEALTTVVAIAISGRKK